MVKTYFSVLYHLFGRSRLEIHVGLDVTRNPVGFRIHDVDAGVPKLGDVGFFIAQEMDVAGGGEPRDAADLAERVGVDGEDDARIVHHHPTHAVMDNHGLGHVAQLETVGANEHLVFHPHRFGIVVGERCVAVHEVALVGDEKAPAGGNGTVPEIFARVELFLHAVAVFHAAGQQEQAEQEEG